MFALSLFYEKLFSFYCSFIIGQNISGSHSSLAFLASSSVVH
jgi:hypothetical protein